MVSAKQVAAHDKMVADEQERLAKEAEAERIRSMGERIFTYLQKPLGYSSHLIIMISLSLLHPTQSATRKQPSRQRLWLDSKKSR